MSGPFMRLGDGGGGQAHGGNAGAITGADGQVTGHDEWLCRQGAQAHVATPVNEQALLGTVDAAGVVGEDRLQGGGDALVSSAQRWRSGGRRGTICGSLAVVMGKSPAAGFQGRFRRVKAAR